MRGGPEVNVALASGTHRATNPLSFPNISLQQILFVSDGPSGLQTGNPGLPLDPT